MSIAIAALLLAGTASAQTPPQAPRAVTRTEFVAAAEARFRRLDTDNDGRLTREERRAGMAARGGRGPGTRPMTREARLARADAAFARLDTDRDGVVAVADRPGDSRLADRDADRDGRVTAAEWRTRATAQFDRLDTNRDGTLTREEIVAARRPAAPPRP